MSSDCFFFFPSVVNITVLKGSTESGVWRFETKVRDIIWESLRVN